MGFNNGLNFRNGYTNANFNNKPNFGGNGLNFKNGPTNFGGNNGRPNCRNGDNNTNFNDRFNFRDGLTSRQTTFRDNFRDNRTTFSRDNFRDNFTDNGTTFSRDDRSNCRNGRSNCSRDNGSSFSGSDYKIDCCRQFDELSNGVEFRLPCKRRDDDDDEDGEGGGGGGDDQDDGPRFTPITDCDDVEFLFYSKREYHEDICDAKKLRKAQFKSLNDNCCESSYSNSCKRPKRYNRRY